MRLVPVDDPDAPAFILKRQSSNDHAQDSHEIELNFCLAARAIFRMYPKEAVSALGEMAGRVFEPVVKGTAPTELLKLHPSEQDLFGQRAFSWGRAAAQGRGGRRDRDDESSTYSDTWSEDSGEDFDYRPDAVTSGDGGSPTEGVAIDTGAPFILATDTADAQSGGTSTAKDAPTGVTKEAEDKARVEEEDDGRNAFSWAADQEERGSDDEDGLDSDDEDHKLGARREHDVRPLSITALPLTLVICPLTLCA